MRKGYVLQTRGVIYSVWCLFPTYIVGRERPKGEDEKAEDSLLPGNSAEWHNNVSYATFPDWRAVGCERKVVDSSEIPVENEEGWNGGDGREEEKEEKERKRTEGVGNAVAIRG